MSHHFRAEFPEIARKKIFFKTSHNHTVVPDVMLARGWKETDGDNWDLYYIDEHPIFAPLGPVGTMKPGQRVNHFRDYFKLTRKDLLSKYLKNAKRDCHRFANYEDAEKFDIMPATFNLPLEYAMFEEEFKKCSNTFCASIDGVGGVSSNSHLSPRQLKLNEFKLKKKLERESINRQLSNLKNGFNKTRNRLSKTQSQHSRPNTGSSVTSRLYPDYLTDLSVDLSRGDHNQRGKLSRDTRENKTCFDSEKDIFGNSDSSDDDIFSTSNSHYKPNKNTNNDDIKEFMKFKAEQKNKPPPNIWIMKPSSGARGNGIFLVDSLSQVRKWKDPYCIKRNVFANCNNVKKNCNGHESDEQSESNLSNYQRATKSTMRNKQFQQSFQNKQNSHVQAQHRTKNEMTQSKYGVEIMEEYVCQKYISNPLLINKRKFDLRVYALVTSYQPLVIYLYRDGFARFARNEYAKNKFCLDDQFTHLTNTSINKVAYSNGKNTSNKNNDTKNNTSPHTPSYGSSFDGKWDLQRVKNHLVNAHGKVKINAAFKKINDMIIASCLSCKHKMGQDPRSFELYGFDVILDQDLRPWLLEINASPSLTATSDQDYELKFGLIDDVLNVIDMEGYFKYDDDATSPTDSPPSSFHQKTKQNDKLERRVGGFDLIYNGKCVHNDFQTHIGYDSGLTSFMAFCNKKNNSKAAKNNRKTKSKSNQTTQSSAHPSSSSSSPAVSQSEFEVTIDKENLDPNKKIIGNNKNIISQNVNIAKGKNIFSKKGKNNNPNTLEYYNKKINVHKSAAQKLENNLPLKSENTTNILFKKPSANEKNNGSKNNVNDNDNDEDDFPWESNLGLEGGLDREEQLRVLALKIQDDIYMKKVHETEQMEKRAEEHRKQLEREEKREAKRLAQKLEREKELSSNLGFKVTLQ